MGYLFCVMHCLKGLIKILIKPCGILKGWQLEQASVSAFVLPTIEEGSALVQGEAMSAGLSYGLAVTTHWSCPQAPGCTDQRGDIFPDPVGIMSHGVEGFIVPPCDSDALADAFQSVVCSFTLS
jgi:glycosyltransferase involved in cell wall biosynthesis